MYPQILRTYGPHGPGNGFGSCAKRFLNPATSSAEAGQLPISKATLTSTFHSTLADIETGSVPSIHKLFSLAACLRVSRGTPAGFRNRHK
jgi:hypothetical protein